MDAIINNSASAINTIVATCLCCIPSMRKIAISSCFRRIIRNVYPPKPYSAIMDKSTKANTSHRFSLSKVLNDSLINSGTDFTVPYILLESLYDIIQILLILKLNKVVRLPSYGAQQFFVIASNYKIIIFHIRKV